MDKKSRHGDAASATRAEHMANSSYLMRTSRFQLFQFEDSEPQPFLSMTMQIMLLRVRCGRGMCVARGRAKEPFAALFCRVSPRVQARWKPGGVGSSLEQPRVGAFVYCR